MLRHLREEAQPLAIDREVACFLAAGRKPVAIKVERGDFSKVGGSANNRMIVSVAFINYARAGFIVTPDAENEGRLLLMPSKMNIAQDPTVVFLVLNDEDAFVHGSLTCRSTVTGTVKANVEPLPTSDSTQMRPPCIPMIRLAIDRPRPVPPFRLVAELSACWNSSKILS